MTASTLDLPRARPRMPGLLVATVGVLLSALGAGLLVSWWLAVAILGIGLALIARPLDLFVSILLLVCAATFVEYGERQVVRDLAVVVVLLLYALLCLVTFYALNRWGLPSSPLTRALAALAATTGVAVVHGLASGQPARFIALEVLPLLGMSTTLVVGGLRLARSQLAAARWILCVLGLATAFLGFAVLVATGRRTQGLPFSPVPGLIALVALNLSLRATSPRRRFAYALLISVLLLHQILSFTRGYWLALFVAIPFSCLLYVRPGAGRRGSWLAVWKTLAPLGLLMLAGAAAVPIWLGWSDVVTMLGGRLASSFTTSNTPETVSNVVRLVELRTALALIAHSPWLGYGHGFTLVVHQFFYPLAGAQWWIHQSYVMMWLKQGVVGLLALLWVMWAAWRMSSRAASNPDPELAGWCGAAAACTVFAAILGLTNYYFFMTTQAFLIALLWGIALATTGPEHQRFAWRARLVTKPPGADPGTRA